MTADTSTSTGLHNQNNMNLITSPPHLLYYKPSVRTQSSPQVEVAAKHGWRTNTLVDWPPFTRAWVPHATSPRVDRR